MKRTVMMPLPMRAPAMAMDTGACRAAMPPSEMAATARSMGCEKLVCRKPLTARPIDLLWSSAPRTARSVAPFIPVLADECSFESLLMVWSAGTVAQASTHAS